MECGALGREERGHVTVAIARRTGVMVGCASARFQRGCELPSRRFMIFGNISTSDKAVRSTLCIVRTVVFKRRCAWLLPARNSVLPRTTSDCAYRLSLPTTHQSHPRLFGFPKPVLPTRHPLQRLGLNGHRPRIYVHTNMAPRLHFLHDMSMARTPKHVPFA